ncbi:hypothetical protein MKW92_009582 [Papaver armeniacum]|nr:hypothetical protein MKW92_009582 [Papaver armeniacum]
MDPQHFPVHGHQSQIFDNPTRSPSTRTGGLTERTPLTLRQRGIYHYPADLSFLSCFVSPPLPHLPTFSVPSPFPDKGWVVLDSLPPENEESYAKGWYNFTEESQAAEVESSQVSDVEAIRNKATGQSESYGSIEFNNHAAVDERQDDSAEFSVFVGNLAAEVTDYVLQETFKVKYTSVKGAKVVTDRTTGRSKVYGFVRFADKDEQMRAVTEMNGQNCLTRPMFIGPASSGTPKGTSCAEKAMAMLNGSLLGGSNIRLAWGHSPSNEQDQSCGMVQQHADPNQWPAAAGNMYGYSGGYINMSPYQGYAVPGYGNYQHHQQQ